MSCGANTTPICPCGTIAFPGVIYNAPGLSTLAYRPGDYVGFRHALLQALAGENELTQSSDGQVTQIWRPGAEGDLAVQMVEWWAYLSDVLAFYNERLANQAYLRTADLPESVNRLIQILGYRPRPALGARGTLAALLTSSPLNNATVTLPKGMQIQSKSGPGQQPQIFELSADTSIQRPDTVAAQAVLASAPLLPGGQASWLWLAGKVGGIRQGDKLLLVNTAALAGQPTTDFAWLSVSGTTPASDPTGTPVTQVAYSVLGGAIASSAQATNYALLRSAQSLAPWSYPTSEQVVTQASIDLAGLARSVGPGDLMLLEVTGTAGAGVATTPIVVQTYAESVWYANGDGPALPIESPPGSVPAISIPHAHVTFASLPAGDWNDAAPQIVARWNWTAVGQLVPVMTAAALAYAGGSTALAPVPGTTTAFPPGENPVLLEDANGNGAAADATTGAGGTLTLSQLSSLPAGGLAPPIAVFFDLLPVTRGKTVPSETLGSGNPAVPGQDFTLSQQPVTYLQDPAAISGDNYSSTVQVAVNGVQWSEVRSFYGQAANAQIFLLREDEQGQTHVVFGDGTSGARLPSGTNNVVARYRYGAGAAAPAAETLTVVLNPQPGLKAIRNPLPPTGGADADPPSRIRALAPQSVMTFGRAVSLDDYHAIAASAPGVLQVEADFAFDPLAQRPCVTLWVAGDEGAVAAVRSALAGAADPNRPVRIIAATAVEATISLTYGRDPRRDAAAIQAALTAALLDPDTGLFGANVVAIGQAFYDSQMYAACLRVPGVLAVDDLSLTTSAPSFPASGSTLRLLSYQRLLAPQPACSGHRHDPGTGSYFSIPNDGKHLNLAGTASS